MWGFIKKDILIIKNSMRSFFLFFLFFLFIVLKDENTLIFLTSFMGTMMFMSTFSYDEYSNWDAYALALPNGKRSFVKSKYVANLLLLAIVVVISTALSFGYSAIKGTFHLQETFSLMFLCLFALTLLQAVLYPFIFRFGIEKGRIAIFILVFSLIGLSSIFVDKIKSLIPVGIFTWCSHYWVIIVIVIMILALYTSYRVSEYVCSKREF